MITHMLIGFAAGCVVSPIALHYLRRWFFGADGGYQ